MAVWELNKPEIISLDRLTFYSAETSAVTGSNYRGHLHELRRDVEVTFSHLARPVPGRVTYFLAFPDVIYL